MISGAPQDHGGTSGEEDPAAPGSAPGGPEIPGDVSADELSEAIAQLHQAEMAIHARLLALVRRFGELEGFRADGAPSLESWLSFRLGIARSTARAWAASAVALGELPHIAEVAAEGRLSHDQLAPLCALATPGDDATLAHEAVGWTPAELRGALAARRAADPAVVEDAHRDRFVATRSEAGALRLSGRLTTEAGAIVLSALDALVAEAVPGPDGEPPDPYPARLADALVALAAFALGDPATPPRPTVVVHVDADALAGEEDGHAEAGDGERIPVATARRLACDCDWQLVAEDADGAVVRLGRLARTAPVWMTRQLRRRDRGCRWPGCGRTRWLHAHHRVHWADGGPTDLDNLVMLCEYHHRFVHEAGWTIASGPSGDLTFTSPDGRTLTARTPPLSPTVRNRLFGTPQASPPPGHTGPSGHTGPPGSGPGGPRPPTPGGDPSAQAGPTGAHPPVGDPPEHGPPPAA
ncbi:MAG: DUF222 domain-containing protein [Actinomycetota bacterium]|nr:DUF222 domain-containing protein [Actinomycetota bacterium]